MSGAHHPSSNQRNPCNVCQHRWTPQQQKDGNGHCYMWQEEPHPCNRPSFKLDEQAFMLDVFDQLMRNVRRGVQS